MLDLVEGMKIVVGETPTTLITAGADWINTANTHVVWAIVLESEGGGAGVGSLNAIHGMVAESYAGASPSTAVCKYWYSNGIGATGFDRLTASTNTTGVVTGSSESIVVVRHDPASADTSDHFFSIVTPTSGWGLSVLYIAEPRYAGENQFLATTSST